MINFFFFFIFCMFLKNHRFWLSFPCRNEFCMQKPPNKHIFIGLAEKSHLLFHFCKAYSLVIFIVIGQKLISTNLAIFGFFPSKKHDSVGIRHFCWRLLEKITKKYKIMINIFFFFHVSQKTIDFGSVFSAEMNSACKSTQISTFS